ncbi:hypothetical protein K461DRAFT_1004 [Myriangium duriaei CBS 260.36]|uniref:Uncharacterized protein n=1 Tax=Myriangium duriaei CBS 260.36 TaxID=1168546 RepID=A0A9P4JD01_9PEZI|nr:hypothetical protein K461DRAFT_1004 [Myriangium duriaei CBS 260.36]
MKIHVKGSSQHAPQAAALFGQLHPRCSILTAHALKHPRPSYRFFISQPPRFPLLRPSWPPTLSPTALILLSPSSLVWKQGIATVLLFFLSLFSLLAISLSHWSHLPVCCKLYLDLPRPQLHHQAALNGLPV